MATRTKNNEPQNKQLVINQIVIKTLNRQNQDIESWRLALKSADNKRRTRLYDLYEDILLDNVLSDAIDKRVRAITNADLIFSINDSEVEEIQTLMETQEWEDMLIEIMLAKFWGVTVLEFNFADRFKAFSFPRTHIQPEKGIITIQENDETGIPYRDDPFFLEVKSREKFGLILKACPYVIYKRGNFGDWAQFAELFGMPFRIGKYNSYDEQTRLQLQQALEAAGSAAYVVIPKEGDIEYRDNKTTGNGELYDKLRQACNEEILYGILGQSMTTVQGDKGARSLGEVHMEVQEGIHASDRRFISRILNNDIIPRLAARGYKVEGGKFSFPEIGETLSLQDRVSVDMQLDNIIEIEPDYFYETYGIPKPKDGGGKKAPATPPEVGGNSSPSVKPGGVEKPEGKVKKKLIAKTKWERLLNFFALAPQGGASRNKSVNYTTLKLDVVETYDIPKLVEAALKNIYEGMLDPGTHFEPNLFKLTWDKINSGIDTAFPGQEWSDPNLNFIYELKHNTGVFSAFKAHSQQNQLVSQLIGEDGKLKSFQQFKTDTQPWVSKQHRWLQTEYDTAVLRARMAAQWKEIERDHDLFPNLKWLASTSVERRVYHEIFYGLVLPYDDPFWRKHFPGNLWNCKCGITNTNETAATAPKITRGMKPDPGLDSNPGLTAELFTMSHPVFSAGIVPFNKLFGLANKYVNTFLMRRAEKAVEAWKQTLPAHNGIDIKAANLYSGSIKILRRAVKDVKEHTTDPFIVLYLPSIEKNIAKWKYIGWKPTIAGKHREADYFLYYETKINGKKQVIRVKQHNHYNSEVLYCISDKAPDGIKKGKPINKKQD